MKRNPSFLLLYSPQRFDTRFGAMKPEGSLGLIYIAGTLRDNGFDVRILDCTVGDNRHDLKNTFYRQTRLPNGMIRIGLSVEEILKDVADYDVIGISSIFTAQTTMVIEVIKAIAQTFPEKLIISGGVNARSQQKLFFDAGVDIICLSEAEKTILEIANKLRNGSNDFRDIEGISILDENGTVRVNHAIYIEQVLGNLPIPAWDMQPLNKYWDIARPHGGGVKDGVSPNYAPMMTSRGCPFKCDFCHIANEVDGSESGNLKKLRLKSIDRVMQEIEILKSLGVRHVYLEDDSLLGKKERAKTIFKKITRDGIKLSGVNGINIAHLCTSDNGKFVVDEGILETMAEAGFTKYMLPVESGSQRIIDRYASGKLHLERHDIIGLIKKTRSLGMDVGGNYTFGYPDETREEVDATVKLAETHMDAGLSNANFMIITPFPGNPFYDMVVRENLFLPDVKIDELDWTQVSIKTRVPKEYLEWVIVDEWKRINKPERITRIRSLAPNGEVANAK